MKVLVPGGGSYIGAVLVPLLLGDGHSVTVYDTMYFGKAWLPEDNDHLRVVKADVRDAAEWKRVCNDQDAVIYLACISRELMCQRHEKLAHEINVEAFAQDIQIAKDSGVRRFIYASSVAIYGSSGSDAKEGDPINPTSIYGRHKAECEEILWKSQEHGFTCTATRAASVCGYSPRQRLDLTINRMVHDGIRKKKITVEGGGQKRSHIHIRDICDFYRLMLDVGKSYIEGQAFNVVAENQTIMQSAEMVAEALAWGRRAVHMPFIEVTERVDDRSYSVDGNKAVKILDFIPKRTIQQAVIDLRARFDSGMWPDSETNQLYQNMREDVS